jgi:hypothetical protein
MGYLAIIERLKRDRQDRDQPMSGLKPPYEIDEINERSTPAGKNAHAGRRTGEAAGDVCAAEPMELPSRRCRACHSFIFWVSIYGVMGCAQCHQPANPDLVRRWYWLPEGECKGTH